MKTFELVFPEGLFCGSTSNIACRSCFTPKNKSLKNSLKKKLSFWLKFKFSNPLALLYFKLKTI